jgi:transcription elongation GreA/GreB family factor
MDKFEVVKKFLMHFQQEHQLLLQSAQTAHEAATHEESRAEDRHDTFAIEASYLAAGQAERVKQLARTVLEFESFLLNGIQANRVQLGSLVHYSMMNKNHFAWIANDGGGESIQIESTLVQVLSLRSPLGEVLEGASVGDEIEFEIRGKERKIFIHAIC